MVKWCCALLLLVSLKAEASGGGFVDLPHQCFQKKSYPCQIRVSGNFLSFERSGNRFHLAEKSSLRFRSESEIQLLEGHVWVKDSKNLKVYSSPVLSFQVHGEWFFSKKDREDLAASNLNGEIEFLSKYVFSSESLPVGFQNWYAGLDSTGQVSRGVIRPIEMKEFLKNWIPVSGTSFAGMKKAAHEYKQRWSEALAKSSDLYQEIVERRLASHEEKKRREIERQRQAEREKSQMRRMFREKNGMSPDHGL